MGIEYATGSRRSMVDTLERYCQEKRTAQKSNYKINRSWEIYDGNRLTRRMMLVEYSDKYCFMVNGSPAITTRSKSECAKQAYVKGYIDYFNYIEIAQGKEAEARARKNKNLLSELKKADIAILARSF